MVRARQNPKARYAFFSARVFYDLRKSLVRETGEAIDWQMQLLLPIGFVMT